MQVTQTLIYILELIGTAAFAVSGAFAAIKKQADVFGVVLLGITTATGGGVLRDVLLGITPPKAFTTWVYITLAAVCAAAAFVYAYIRGEKAPRGIERIDAVNNVFDAAGLGVFTVYGVKMAIESGFGGNVILALFLGMITGVGGGILRDTMINEIPFVLRKRVYAVASLAGGLVFYILVRLGVNEAIDMFAGIAVVFALRLLATKYKWSLPRARIE